mgnify:CR=1 FL=1
MTQSAQAPTSQREPVVWEEFHSLALPLLGQHFPPNLVKDNGDSILFVDRRERLRFLLTENARRITIGYYGERNTGETFCSTPSIALATVCLELLVRDGMDKFVDITYTPHELLGPVPDTVFSISKDHLPFFQLTSTIDPTVSATCRSFACARAIAEASTPSLGSPRL